MTTFNYILSYNPVLPSLTQSQVHVFIERNRDIQTWYLPFVGTYILKSNLTLAELTTPFGQFFGSNFYILTYVVPTLISGSLPPTVWNWLAESTPAIGSN